MTLRTLSIPEINELSHGELIPRFTGRIVKVFDQKTGEGQYGPWHLQTFMLAQGQDEISVTYTGEDTLNDWEGAAVSIECSDNKGKLAGVLRDVRVDKEGKTWKGVKVTPAAKIKRLGDEKNEDPKLRRVSRTLVSNADLQDADPYGQHGEIDGPALLDSEIPKSSESKQNPSETKPKPNGDKITAYTQHASRVFAVAWEQSKDIMALIPKEDGEGMSTFEWNDLRLRIAQNFAIEVAKIIRKERF